MNTFKQFFSATTAFLLAAGLTLSASAEAIRLQNNDTVSLNSDMHAQNQQITEKIGEYDCWLIDGQYYTALDDEICIRYINASVICLSIAQIYLITASTAT